MFGTLVNMLAIIVGSTAGQFIRTRLPERFIEIVFQAVGLATLGIGISMSLQSKNMVISVVSIVLGAVIGEWVGIEKRLTNVAEKLKKRLKFKSERFSEAFITASMLYIVGSMAILGSIEEGLGHPPRLLYAKSLLDGIVAVPLAATLGIGVVFSVIIVFIYQGSITIFASYMSTILAGSVVAEMTAVGGLLLIGLGIKILKIKDIQVMNMLPALIVAPILAYLFG